MQQPAMRIPPILQEAELSRLRLLGLLLLFLTPRFLWQRNGLRRSSLHSWLLLNLYIFAATSE